MGEWVCKHVTCDCIASEVVALRKRVEELWFDLCEYQKHEQQLCPEEEGFVTYIPKLKARAEEAETGLARALPIWEEALKLARERAEKAERERDAFVKVLDPDNLNVVGAMANAQALQRLQADLDAALDWIEGVGGPMGRGGYPTDRVLALLEKRRESK